MTILTKPKPPESPGGSGLRVLGGGLAVAALIDAHSHPYRPPQSLMRLDSAPSVAHNGGTVDTAALLVPTGKLVQLRVTNNRSVTTDLGLLTGGLLMGAGVGAAMTSRRP